MVAGRHLTAAMQGGPLERLLAANPPTAGWALRDLLALGVPGEAPTLARLASHPEEASAQAPVPYEEGSRDYEHLVRSGKLTCRPYPLHSAAEHAASPAVVARLLELCPAAVRTRDQRGRFPIHIAAVT
eukprot:scaffold70808_cov39-Phaeocystis_antarctica.AAC.1